MQKKYLYTIYKYINRIENWRKINKKMIFYSKNIYFLKIYSKNIYINLTYYLKNAAGNSKIVIKK